MREFSAKCIDFSYENKVILSQASLEIPEGSIVGILGPNGSGKTTFFDIACELKKITSGEIKNDFSDFAYLSQIITTPPSLRMRDIFKMIIALSSDEHMTQSLALDKLSCWSPTIVKKSGTKNLHCAVMERRVGSLRCLCYQFPLTSLFSMSLQPVSILNFATTFGNVFMVPPEMVPQFWCHHTTLMKSLIIALTFI